MIQRAAETFRSRDDLDSSSSELPMRAASGLIGTAAGEDFAEDAVRGSIELRLELVRVAAGLIDQGWVKNEGDAVGEGTGSRCARVARRAPMLARLQLLIQLEVAPEIVGILLRPIQGLAEGYEEFLAEKIEHRDGKFPADPSPHRLAGAFRGPSLRVFFSARGAYGYPHFQAFWKRCFHAQDHGEDGFTANSLELFAVVGGMVGAAGAAVLRGVHVEESLDHFILVEGAEKKGSGFARADDKLSRTEGHRSL